MRLRTLDILFVVAFLFSLSALTITHYVLANGGQEIAPITSIAIYHYVLSLNWLFAAEWTFLTFIYILLRGGRFQKSDDDRMGVVMYPVILFFFCFVDMWNDILVSCYLVISPI